MRSDTEGLLPGGSLLSPPSGPREWERGREEAGRAQAQGQGCCGLQGALGWAAPGFIQPWMHFPLLQGTACAPGKRLPCTDIRGSPKPAGARLQPSVQPGLLHGASASVHTGSSHLQPVRKA